MKDQKDHPKFIQTISGQGYSFIARAEPVIEADYEPSKLAESAAPPDSSESSVTSPHRRYIVPAILVFCIALIAIPFRSGLPNIKLSNAVRITQSASRILSPLLTDGARLYFQRFENGQYRIAQVATSGGETVDVLVGLSNPELCDIAPNGGALLVREIVHSRDDNEPVYIRPVVGGTIRRLGAVSAFDAAWYPDGQHVMYTRDGAFYKTDSDGGSQQELFSVSGKAYWIRWSPDAKRFRFTLMDQKTDATSIWEASPDGGLSQRL